jgi:hypothetical protein
MPTKKIPIPSVDPELFSKVLSAQIGAQQSAALAQQQQGLSGLGLGQQSTGGFTTQIYPGQMYHDPGMYQGKETVQEPNKSPYSFEVCSICGEYDFARHFQGCIEAVDAERSKLLRQAQDTLPVYRRLQLVCGLCYEKSYLNENETEEAYKTRMVIRKARKTE